MFTPWKECNISWRWDDRHNISRRVYEEGDAITGKICSVECHWAADRCRESELRKASVQEQIAQLDKSRGSRVFETQS